jgi:hypothetical protein
MLCNKELSGDLDQAKLNKHGLREVWLDIVDNSRIDIAFTPPSNSDGDARTEGEPFPGAEGARFQREPPVPVQSSCAPSHIKSTAAEIPENPGIGEVEEADELKLRFYRFN